MANKLVQQQLKNIIRSLSDQELEKVLVGFEVASNAKVEKSCRMISYKCYEAALVCKNRKANGYGRNETEASMNCIKNFLEFVIEEEVNIPLVMRALKKESENVHHQQQHPSSQNTITKSPQKPPSNPLTKSHGIPPRDLDKVNNTLALNVSYGQGLENNSFEGNLELLSKNIGNISMINNSKIHEPNGNNVSQLEMDDLILKMMLEEGNQKKGLPPTHSHSNHQNHNTRNENQHFEPNIQTKLQNAFDNLTSSSVQKSLSKANIANELDPSLFTKKALQETNTNVYNQIESKYETKNEYKGLENKSENKFEPKFEKGTEAKYETYNPSSSSSKLKSSYSSQTLASSQVKVQNYTSVAEPIGKENQFSGNGKCTCGCSEQLQKANLKIESLEKKIKLLLEENKILKYLATDPKETYSKTEMSTNASNTNLNVQTKSLYEKSVTQPNENYTTPDQYDDFNDLPEKNVVQSLAEKNRSQSVDVYAKRKNVLTESRDSTTNKSSSTNKENYQPEGKKDIKKMIPRLRLEMLPNYHAKTQTNNSTNATQPQATLNQSNSFTKSGSMLNQVPIVTKSPLGQSNTNSIQNINANTLLYSQNHLSGSSLSKYIKK